MNIQLNTHEWLKLPTEVRNRMAEIFKIPKSQGTFVEDGKVKSDGYTYEDLSAVTSEKMEDYLKSFMDEPTPIVATFGELFDLVISKIESEKILQQVSPNPSAPDPVVVQLETWSNTLLGMKQHAASQGMEFHLESLIHRLFPQQLIQNANVPTRLPAKKAVSKKAK